jgi:NADH:ubiquinone oxidoreductase subunit 6 (subunit J)
MIVEVLSVGIVIAACLAIFADEAVYSVVALAGTFFFTAVLYALNDAVLVAVFQFAVGVGTLAVLFLSGEMLSETTSVKTQRKNLIAVTIAGALLSLPAILISLSGSTITISNVPFGEALWELRAGDVVVQGLVILTVTLGIAIVLYDRKNGEK